MNVSNFIILLGFVLPIGCRGNGASPTPNALKALASKVSDSMCFSRGCLRRKGTGFLCPIHWRMEPSIHFGQSGNAGRTPNCFLTLLPFSLTLPFSPLTNAALLSLLPGERSHQPPCNPVPVVWNSHDTADCFNLTVPKESLKAFRYNPCFNYSISYIIPFIFDLRCVGQHIAAHHLLP